MRAGAVSGLLLVAALVLPGIAVAQQYSVYVGTDKAEPSSGTPPRIAPARSVAQPSISQGIYGWRFDTATTALSPLGVVAKTANPAHVWISPNGKYLDAVNWQENSARVPAGVSAYAIDTNTGALKFLSKQTSAGELPNQVVIDPSGKVAAAVNCKTGNMALFPAHLDGTLGEPFAVIGGNPAHVDGQPGIITTSAGKAVLFDRVHDGLFIDKHPPAGFSQFTFEALVRPDGGDPAQRWFHLAEIGLDATTDPNNPTADKNAFHVRAEDRWRSLLVGAVATGQRG